TTGILIGIGETLEERADSLLAIRDLDDRHGHIQEVIVQNFRRKPEIPMHDAPEPGDLDIARTVAAARLILGADMNLQAPPNLNPATHRLLLRAGINDWGGISPLTADYVNPEAPWPHLAKLAATCAEEGYTLRPRLAIYPEFIERDGFLDSTLRQAVMDEQRRRQAGDVVTYVVNRNINFTNVCIKHCTFCAFSRDHRAEQGYLLPMPEVVRRAREAWDYGATEVCIQAGLPPKMDGWLYV